MTIAAEYGMRPVKTDSGNTVKAIPLIVASGQVFTPGSATGADLQPGDPLVMLATGNFVTNAEIGGQIDYVMVGVQQMIDTSKGVLGPASKVPSGTVYGATRTDLQTEVLAVPVAGQVFEIDSSVSFATLALAQANIGANADLVFTTTAADLNGTPRLGAEIASGATGQVRIVGVSGNFRNQELGANMKFLVMVNESSIPPYSTTGQSPA